ncbi:MAG: hypothetical protein R2781_02720 [Flavobacteriaceae bacterium]
MVPTRTIPMQTLPLSLGAASNVPFDGSRLVQECSTETLNYEIGEAAATEITFDCSQLGLNQVEITVTDDSGNSSTCTATVNVMRHYRSIFWYVWMPQ